MLAALALFVFTGGVVAHSVRDAQLRSTGAYGVAMARVAVDATVGAALGRPISRGLWVEVARGERLTLRIPLQGTQHRGTLSLIASPDGAIVEAMVLEANGQRTDLLAIDAELLRRNLAREAWTVGSEHLERGSYAEAAAALSEALALDASMTSAWLRRGQARLAMGELEAAEADLQEAARRDPADPEAPTLLGQLYTASQRYEDCVAAYTTALTLDADSSPLWLQRAICYAHMRDHRRALAGAREACMDGLTEACAMQDRLKRAHDE